MATTDRHVEVVLEVLKQINDVKSDVDCVNV